MEQHVGLASSEPPVAEDLDSACNKNPRSAEDLDSACNKNPPLAEDLDSACNKNPRFAEDLDSAAEDLDLRRDKKPRLAKHIVSACNKKPRRHKKPRRDKKPRLAEDISSTYKKFRWAEDHDSAWYKKPRGLAKNIVSAYKRRARENKLIQQKRIDPKYLPFFKDYQLPMTDEEDRLYNKIVSESEGFDAPYIPHFNKSGGIAPYSVGKRTPNELRQYCKEALRIFNSNNKSNYGFVELVKCTFQFVTGIVYRITFKAKDPSDRTCLIFETRVWRKIMNEGFEVELCRMKSTQ